LGASYLFGVGLDRLADTILSPIEHYLRLSLAKDCLLKRKSTYEGDPFPQDQLEFSLRQADDGRLAWMDSLRGRIRTTRALSVMGAPAAMGIAIFFRWNTHGAKLHWWPHSFVIVNLFLVLGSVLVLWLTSWCKHLKQFKAARTNELANRTINSWNYAVGFSSLYVLMLLQSLTVTALVLPGSALKRFAVWICGAAVVSLALISWSQITKTYLAFIYRHISEFLKAEGKIA